jgi:hypothetical protein
MWPTSYVRKSGQAWKLAIAGVLLFGGGGLVVIMASGRGDSLEPGTFIAVLRSWSSTAALAAGPRDERPELISTTDDVRTGRLADGLDAFLTC